MNALRFITCAENKQATGTSTSNQRRAVSDSSTDLISTLSSYPDDEHKTTSKQGEILHSFYTNVLLLKYYMESANITLQKSRK